MCFSVECDFVILANNVINNSICGRSNNVNAIQESDEGVY